MINELVILASGLYIATALASSDEIVYSITVIFCGTMISFACFVLGIEYGRKIAKEE